MRASEQTGRVMPNCKGGIPRGDLITSSHVAADGAARFTPQARGPRRTRLWGGGAFHVADAFGAEHEWGCPRIS
jgi:hypothetical protein